MPSATPTTVPTTEGYRLANFSVAAPANLVEATVADLVVKNLTVRLHYAPSEDVEVRLRAYGAAATALRVYDEDPARRGYALASDPGSASATKVIPAGATTLTVMVGALRDRINNGASFSQSVDCLLYTSPSPRDKRQSRMPSSA